MVVDPDVQAARAEFKGWFQAETERAGFVGRGAIERLYEKLVAAKRSGHKVLVSRQQLRKYYRGIDYPKPDTLQKLCAQLKFQPPPAHFTRMLEIKPPKPNSDVLFAQLQDAWNQITEPAIRREIVEFARFKALSSSRGARGPGKSGAG